MIHREADGLYVVDQTRIENSDKFRQAAIHFQKYGYYTAAPVATTGYLDYWREERTRCLRGYYSEDGDWISGYHYFYLNYCPILLVREETITDTKGHVRKVVERKRDFPDFWDSDYNYFSAIETAQREGKHLVVLKARSKGYSFKGGSMLCRNFFLIKSSLSYAVASEMEFLLKDGLLSKAWEFMDFIDQNTAWAKKRQKLNTRIQRRASYIVTDERGVKSEAGYKSEIMGVSLKNDPDKIRGKRGQLILWEEGGKFPELVKAWQVAQSLVEKDGIAFGLMVGFGTGGTEESDYGGLKELFLYPDGYNALPFKNIWDDGGGKCGFFVPEYVNMYGKDKEGHQFMDAGGNTDYHVATRYALTLRDVVLKGANDRMAIDRYIAEHPFNPTEACLQISGNIFPKEELIRHLAYVRNTEALKNYKQVGDLEFSNEKLVWYPSVKPKDITKYKLRSDDNKRGQIVIWEHPADNPPYGLYIAGCLTPGEKVNTEQGLKNVEAITLDDKLVSKDGDFVKINTLLRYEKLEESVHRIKMSNILRTTNYTQEHPLYLSKTPYNSNKTINEDKFKFDFVKAGDAKKGMWTKYPNYYCKNIKYSLPFKISDEDYFWWFVGMWLGDGWVSTDKVYVCFNKLEIEYLEYFRSFVEDVLGRKIYSRVRNNCVEVSFGHKELSDFLSTTFGKGSLNKKLPEWVKFIHRDYKANLIQGYLDSDGCITKNNKYYSTEFVSISQELLEGFQDILFSMGIVSNMNLMREPKTSTIEGRLVKQLSTYHLRLSHHSTLDLVKKLPFTDDIKIKRIDFDNLPDVRVRPKDGCFISKDLEYIYLQIKNIEDSTYTGTVYNFDCETHTFICQYCTGHNCDPYDHDQAATSDSLGSVFIYKRFQNFESFYDVIVAEFTGRPDTVNEFYENVRKLLIYYNAKLLYENEKPGLFAYFTNKHCDYLLADQPDIIKKIISNSKVQRSKGIHMAVGIKDWAELKVRDWLNEEYQPGKKNLTKILSEALIEELISYTREGNFDRVIAFMLVMVYKEELHNVHVKHSKEEEHTRNLFKQPLFRSSDIPRFINI